MKIAICSSGGKNEFGDIERWLRTGDEDFSCLDAGAAASEQEALALLDTASGLVIGGDYRFESIIEAEPPIEGLPLGTSEAARAIALINRARELRLPLLASGPAALLINTAFGGKIQGVIEDSSGSGAGEARRSGSGLQRIMVTPGSLLKKITGELEGEVNSGLSPGIETFGKGLHSAAVNADGVLLAIEPADVADSAFLLGMLWKPEYLPLSNSFSRAVSAHFTFECYSYHLLLMKD